MRLSSLAPLPANLVSSLDKCGIRTESDLLLSGSPIDILRKLPHGTVSLQEFTNYTALVAERASAFRTRADVLLNTPTPSDNRLITGVSKLDELLRGIGGFNVVEISGDKCSGKTVRAAFESLGLKTRNCLADPRTAFGALLSFGPHTGGCNVARHYRGIICR